MSAQIFELLGQQYPTGFRPRRVRLNALGTKYLSNGCTLTLEQMRNGGRLVLNVTATGPSHASQKAPLHLNMLSDLTVHGFFIAPRAIEYDGRGLAKSVWLDLYSINKAMRNIKRGYTDGISYR